MYGVNEGPDTSNVIHAHGVSTHARFTCKLGLFCNILTAFKGLDVTNQKAIDDFMLELDGTPNKGM